MSIRKITAALTMMTFCAAVADASWLEVKFDNGSWYEIEVTEDLEYSFADNVMQISSANSDLTLQVENINGIRYKAHSGIANLPSDRETPKFRYTGSLLTVTAGEGINRIDIYDMSGICRHSSTFYGEYTFDPRAYCTGPAIVTINGKHSIKIKR